jgi:TRAP-type C4-dicarboxylate transport system permease small subunit
MIQTLLSVRRGLEAVNTAAAVLSAGAVVFACFAVSWAVLARGVAGMNTIWELEASVYLLIYAAFLSAAFADRGGGQIAVDFLRNKLTGRARRIHRTLLDAIALLIFGLLLVSGWDMFSGAWARGWHSETLWGPPLWIPYLAVPLGSALMVATLAVDIALRAAGRDLPVDQGATTH